MAVSRAMEDFATLSSLLSDDSDDSDSGIVPVAGRALGNDDEEERLRREKAEERELASLKLKVRLMEQKQKAKQARARVASSAKKQQLQQQQQQQLKRPRSSSYRASAAQPLLPAAKKSKVVAQPQGQQLQHQQKQKQQFQTPSPAGASSTSRHASPPFLAGPLSASEPSAGGTKQQREKERESRREIERKKEKKRVAKDKEEAVAAYEAFRCEYSGVRVQNRRIGILELREKVVCFSLCHIVTKVSHLSLLPRPPSGYPENKSHSYSSLCIVLGRVVRSRRARLSRSTLSPRTSATSKPRERAARALGTGFLPVCCATRVSQRTRKTERSS